MNSQRLRACAMQKLNRSRSPHTLPSRRASPNCRSGYLVTFDQPARRGRETRTELALLESRRPILADESSRASTPRGLRPHSPHAEAGPDGRDSVQDPVCGMKVVPATAAGSLEHDGRTYYFCSRHCLEKFRSDPARFTAGTTVHEVHGPSPIVPAPAPLKQPAPVGTTYTCPMHPEIVRDRPGACPICGMALEPIAVLSEEEPEDPELVDMTRRFWICLALTIPLLVLSMAEMIPGFALPAWLGGRTWVGIQLALASPVVVWGGFPFFRARLVVVGQSPAQYVHADRAGDRIGVRLQHGRGDRAGHLSRFVPRPRWRGLGLLRAGRGHHDARAAGAGPRAAARRQTGSAIRALLGLRPGRRGDSVTVARRKTSRWIR